MRIGEPAQIVYLLAGTSSSITTAVGSVWCNDLQSGYNCEARGRSFDPTESTTWDDQGQWALGIRSDLVNEQQFLQYTSKDYSYGNFGLESLSIANDQHRNLRLPRQVVAVVNDTTQLLGSLGLAINSRSFRKDEKYASFVSTLFDSGKIPSKSVFRLPGCFRCSLTYSVPRSWAYTAGNYHRTWQTPTDVVLGGKNLGRYTPNDKTFRLDANQDPVANLQQLTVSATGNPPWGPGSETLVLQPVSVRIDSTTPFLWLPEEACRQFEKALGLTWNTTTSLYLMNDPNLYDDLTRLNMTFTFTLSDAPGSSSSVVEIKVPYSSLDLDISWPYLNTTDRIKYFPLKRSLVPTEYTLGRAFLQEAYLVVDYSRGNFSVHQALFPPNNDQVEAIPLPGDETAGGGGPGAGAGTGKPANGLPVAAIAGIAVGAVLAVTALLAAVVWVYRRGGHRDKQQPDAEGDENKPEDTHEIAPPIWEAYGDSAVKLPNSLQGPASEMPGDGNRLSRSELPAVNFEPAELTADDRPTQLTADDRPTKPRKQRFSWEDGEAGGDAQEQDVVSPLVPRLHPDLGNQSPVTPNSEPARSRPVSDLSSSSPAAHAGGQSSADMSPVTPVFRH